jgi:hypothetical protein
MYRGCRSEYVPHFQHNILGHAYGVQTQNDHQYGQTHQQIVFACHLHAISSFFDVNFDETTTGKTGGPLFKTSWIKVKIPLPNRLR